MQIRLREALDASSASWFTGFSRSLRIFSAAALLSVLAACDGNIQSTDNSALQALIQTWPQQKGDKKAAIAAKDLIAPFYQARSYQPAWTDKRKRKALRELVRNAPSHGLNPEDYHASLLDQPVGEIPEEQALAEIIYTDALARLAYHLRFGKVNPRALHAEWNYGRSLRDTDAVVALEALVNARDLKEAVEAFEPQLPQYAALQSALDHHEDMAKAGGWPQVPRGPTLKPGMTDNARVPLLRARLQASGDLKASRAADAAAYDETLQEAVARFQERHGIVTDGVVAGQTLAALNVPIEKRIDQLKVNLERIRWIASALPRDFVVVDVAGYTATLIRDGRPAWTSRVVVGQPYRETPVFRAEMTQVVLNPTWTVPPTIFKEDLLPKMEKDPAHLARVGMQVLDEKGNPTDEEWREGLLVRQPPGPQNPLGLFKFDMPNEHAVYLHDTPAKQRFEKEIRAFSSGCIRLEKARELAELLLGEQPQWTAKQIDETIATGETKIVALKQKIPVLILYFTAIPRDDSVEFRPDIYKRDAPLAVALKQPFKSSAAKKLTDATPKVVEEQ